MTSSSLHNIDNLSPQGHFAARLLQGHGGGIGVDVKHRRAGHGHFVIPGSIEFRNGPPARLRILVAQQLD